MRVVVTIPYTSAPTAEYPDGEPRVILTPLFAFFDLSENEAPALNRPLRPSQEAPADHRPLRPLGTDQGRGGLRHDVQVRHRPLRACAASGQPSEVHRDLPDRPLPGAYGRTPGKLQRGPDFIRRVLETATLEVNGLSDCSVQIEPVRKNPRAPITAVTITWWRKGGRRLPPNPPGAPPAQGRTHGAPQRHGRVHRPC